MARDGSDRNLLFGVLALQMDFITRDALIAAMHAWVLEKDKSLGRILVEQGALDESDFALIEPLVAKHVERHGGNPERSLEALSSVSGLRSDLRAVADADLHASLDRLGAAPPVRVDPWETVAPSVGEPTSIGQRFRILRPHASGGLGEVYVARDEELHRDVALKQIKDSHADHPESRSRFLLEAEVTGGLEHPGIVPVYGLGHYPDGRPFYAMRFIRGDSLKEAIDRFHEADRHPRRDPGERTLSLRQLLRRFVDVCNAVAYAHSRGVLHRDLKPGNVMLGPYGETLVVDWGLAKPIGRPAGVPPSAEGTLRPSSGSGVSPTQMGTAVGTPAFMSPEQAAGRMDQLGPASDVYSLGAMFYSLLTGRPPVEGELADVLRKVEAAEFPPPRQVNQSAPRALEAICLKATAKAPGDRYPSPKALADEIEHWLADEPVSAHREGPGEQLARWMRRHRAGTQAAAAALAVIAVVAIISAFFIDRARRHEGEAVETARTALAAERVALKQAGIALAAETTANARAREQQKRAEDREHLAIDAVRKFRNAVQANPDLKQRPELGALRKALLKEPLEFFKKLRDLLQSSKDTTPEILERLALANLDLGGVTSEVGSFSDASRSFEEAIELLEGLARNHPQVALYREELARAHVMRGLLVGSSGNSPEALKALRRALALREQLARAQPSNSRYQSDLVRVREAIGVLLPSANRPDEAVKLHRQAGESARDQPHENGPPDAQARLAFAQEVDGLQMLKQGRPSEAIPPLQRAVAIFERLARDNPGNAELRIQLAIAHDVAGSALRQSDRQAEAMAAFQRAVTICEPLARDNPAVILYQHTLASSCADLGHTLQDAGNHSAAASAFRRSLEIRQRLLRDNPTLPQFQRNLAAVHASLGSSLWFLREYGAAAEAHRQANAICSELLAKNPGDLACREALAISQTNLGNALWASGDRAGGIESCRQAIVTGQALLAASPGTPEYHRPLGRALNNRLATSLRQLRQFSEAIRLARARRTLWYRQPDELYNVACDLALCLPSVEAAAERDALAAETVATLKRAIAAGWINAHHTSHDPDLDALRDRQDFRTLLAELFDRAFPADPFAR
jgi:serine/threonine-protein kinase